ncbi:MAG: nucleotidyl transferase AbiEii/AbiGii toxin family protein [Candidatus Cloacimonetes bacterium]|nr:nucleotidyl transferase AbiEii/AbiGii toxin family protein [Candidatus Cloacimonadota bacterium]
MQSNKTEKYKVHNDKEYFQKAIYYTSSRTEINQELIEKDYYCSLLLDYLFGNEDTQLVFKGGTCISKVYTDFYRMSEDLDFMISVSTGLSKNTRKGLICPIRQDFDKLLARYNCLNWKETITGHNESKQYIGKLEYNSVIGAVGRKGIIKIEIGLREELVEEVYKRETSTLLIAPFREERIIQSYKTNVPTINELYAEKFRAALTRREPAIRDFFDIFYAMKNLQIDFKCEYFLELVRRKLFVPGNLSVNMSLERKKKLKLQVDSELKPVLRRKDFQDFNFDEVFEFVGEIAQKL